MAKKPKRAKTTRTSRPERVKLSAEVVLRRMESFDERKEAFIAAIRKGKDRSVSA